MDRREHWEQVYSTKGDAEVSWTQARPAVSLALIGEVCPAGGRVIDVGGGSSSLAGYLLEAGYRAAVLDISKAALDRARARIGTRAHEIEWLCADVTDTPSVGAFDLWHDRAVFHFLTDAEDRAAYKALLSRTVPSGGHAIIATFALDGPEKCSGLPVQRYSAQTLARELGTGFSLVKTIDEMHTTPWGKPQAFQYSVFRRV
jgi:SAM-dependent methyltransferase